MKILVTGAAGFIGFHVSQGLLARGDEIVGLDNMNAYYDPRLKTARLEILRRYENFRFAKLDLVDRGGIEALFAVERFNRVIHLAAQAGVRYSSQNPHIGGAMIYAPWFWRMSHASDADESTVRLARVNPMRAAK